MSNEVMVALVTGVLGLLAAVVACVQTIRVSRIAAQTKLAIESLKADAERHRKAFEVASIEARPLEEALSHAWTDIQTIKEVLARLAAPVHYDPESALATMMPALTRLNEGYAKWGSVLPESAQAAWHSAKAGASTALIEAQDYLRVQKDQGIPRKRVRLLRNVRLTLTDQQEVLSAARQAIRDQHLRSILEAL